MVTETIFNCSCGFSGSLEDYDEGVGDFKDSLFCPNCKKEHRIHYVAPVADHRMSEDEKADIRSKLAKMKARVERHKKLNENVYKMFLDMYRGMKVIADAPKEQQTKRFSGAMSVSQWAKLSDELNRKLSNLRDFAQGFVDECHDSCKQVAEILNEGDGDESPAATTIAGEEA